MKSCSIVESHHKDNELTTIINYGNEQEAIILILIMYKSRLAKKQQKKKDIFIAFGKKIKQRKIEHLTMSHFLGN